MACSTRRCTGFSPSRTSGSARPTIRLLNGEKRRGPGSGDTGRGYGEGKRRRAHRVGELRNHDDVALAEREVEGLDLPLEALDRLDDCLLATGRLVFLQTPQAFGRIGRLDEVLGHGVLLGVKTAPHILSPPMHRYTARKRFALIATALGESPLGKPCPPGNRPTC